MKGSAIEELVIVKLDEQTPFSRDGSDGPLTAGGDDIDELKPIYSYVKKSLTQAANEMLRTMPLHLLGYKECTDAPKGYPDGTGYIPLPIDFIRIHSLMMDSWSRPVTYITPEGDPAYMRQFNKHTRGHKNAPVAILDKLYDDDYGENPYFILRYFSTDGTHNVKHFYYIPVFSLEADYSDDVAEAIALNCARKVCEVFGMTEQVKIFSEELNALISNTNI